MKGMTIADAILIAKTKCGARWVCVGRNGVISWYSEEPTCYSNYWIASDSIMDNIGIYDSDLDWKDTLTMVV